MKVMLTLFHHSLPPWAGEYGGWRMEKTANYFMDFVRYSSLAVKLVKQINSSLGCSFLVYGLLNNRVGFIV